MSILILSSHLRLGLPSGLLHLGFLTKTLYTPPLPHMHYMPRQSSSHSHVCDMKENNLNSVFDLVTLKGR
jgi:hypothetical protein